jgi:hypothetical protein
MPRVDRMNAVQAWTRVLHGPPPKKDGPKKDGPKKDK